MGAVYRARRKAGDTPDAIYNSSTEILQRKFKQEYDADKATEKSNAEYGAQRVAAATLGNERALARDNAEAALAQKHPVLMLAVEQRQRLPLVAANLQNGALSLTPHKHYKL